MKESKESKFLVHGVLAVIMSLVSAWCFITTAETSTQNLLLSIGTVASFIMAIAHSYACYLLIEEGGLE